MWRSSDIRWGLKVRARRWRRRGGVLMYHRICAEVCDPWAICVTPEAFAEQMAVLADARAAVDLGAFTDDTAYTRAGRQIAVTFDDGYVDNMTAALPVLERYEIPATLFLVGRAVGRTREFWWDAVDRAVLHDAALPEVLHFPFGSGPQTYTLHEAAGATVTNAGWRADGHDRPTPRQRLFRTLWDAIVVLEPAEQDAAVDHLLAWAGRPVEAPAARRPMDAEQFARFAAHPLITVGSHTLDHASLTDLTPEMQTEQIVEGHRRVAELADSRVTRFSYPFGRFDRSAIRTVGELGVELACTSVPLPATLADDRRVLPRLHATDMDGDRFARWLRDDHRLLAAQ
ncbi:polysaccharide deacetylase family protein [Gordonia sp. LSe1-13]|uniref:Polysaccharide deacetylase family protein n=1 Tax=Gordonia sesuvii TaxID=3116777 RepID=A0ABU7MAV0_9ACTN|nr:polysaccharide deacetylase family protein [Gordonia sp. LSe1-13]